MKNLIALIITLVVQTPKTLAAIGGSYPALESVVVQSQRENDPSRTKLYLAGLVGGSLLDENRGVRVTFGGRAGLLLNSKISLGGYYNRLPVASNTLGTVNMNTIMGEAMYSLYGQNQGVFIGARAGTTFTIVNRDGAFTTHSGIGLMPVVGFEDVIDANLMWGIEANYLVSTNDITPQGFGLLGSLKLLLF